MQRLRILARRTSLSIYTLHGKPAEPSRQCVFWQRIAVIFLLLLLFCIFFDTLSASPASRRIPSPLPDHPGNIFLLDEKFGILLPEPLPPGALHWRLVNDLEDEVTSGMLPATTPDRLFLPNPGIGWYRFELLNSATNRVAWTTAAVLARLKSPTPLDSPISLDAAISWFARDDGARQAAFANLAAMAGVNWVRDRLRWRDVQPAPDHFVDSTSYDGAANAQHGAGLQVLQVFHDTPPWAQYPHASRARFSEDLRTVHQFAVAMALRFQGRVQAWEPWNEANVASFGAHSVDEMCTWQKAAWLGFKSADPGLIVGWNPTAGIPTPQHTEGLQANGTTAYFDTYNIHTYDWPHDYEKLWGPARQATGGKPLWITEADRGLKHLNNPPDYDLPWPGERLKAEALIQEYALSLAAGATQHFHFILGHYHEPNGVQFGLLRRDLTPRPAYVALAATGRFLAGAQLLGQWQPENHVHVIAFHARPDGHDHDVLVVWAELPVEWDGRGRHFTPNPLPDNLRCVAAYDYLGRTLPSVRSKDIGTAPRFVVLPPGEARRLPLTPPAFGHSSDAATSHDVLSPLVLQILWPESKRTNVTDLPWSEGHAYTCKPGESIPFKIVLYNFGDLPAEGTLVFDEPLNGWSLSLHRNPIHLAPGQRLITEAECLAPVTSSKLTSSVWIRVRGRFTTYPESVVAFRCVQEP